MAIKNYYAILGVSCNETPAGIRAAYRDAARRTHPDHAGPQETTTFQEIVEAYSVLSDPSQRLQYDRTVSFHERDRSQYGLLDPFAAGRVPHSIFADTHAVHPSFEELAERLMRNFTGRTVPKAEKPEGLSVEVILTPEEAARGGVLSIGIPIREVCSACGGTGDEWPFTCLHCRGEGTVSRMRPVQLRVPQAISLGTVPDVSLEPLGINNLFLQLRIRVSNEHLH